MQPLPSTLARAVEAMRARKVTVKGRFAAFDRFKRFIKTSH